ncbi:DUF411 domain-containing protein [Bradyrhizobium sp. SRS-191]|uniref:DUF411 domain-containing protein n=1 Tax=Bradyrhizobium sp. SRS-191 TaxID=2962606 RepID=UPI00211E4F98|nr:DUF411 domain-containing protein [Bradyrhizobium sp. SRS-191]
MKHEAYPLTRRSVLSLVTAGMLAVPVAAAFAEEVIVRVHKDPNCGCCSGWVQHLRDAGYAVKVDETSDLESVRAHLHVPANLAACHTAEVAGYVVEGHVPAAAIRRLLLERPNALGVAVPGMPTGSPGMEGGRPVPYSVVLFGADGQRPFMRFVGDRAVG